MSSSAEEPPTRARAAGVRASLRSVRILGIVVIVIGVVFLVAGVTTYVVVQNTLADEHITVSDDAAHFAGKPVKGPLTAYAQANAIEKHATEMAGGKTYSELPQDDPKRQTVMTASFLRASLFTSVVAFGVAVLVAALGVTLGLVGWALLKVGGVAP
jgi:ABC-type sugar transport system permease subunit